MKKVSGARRVARELRRGGWVRSDHLYRRTACVVHSRIAELRARGWEIECDREQGKNGAIYTYRAKHVPAGWVW